MSEGNENHQSGANSNNESLSDVGVDTGSEVVDELLSDFGVDTESGVVDETFVIETGPQNLRYGVELNDFPPYQLVSDQIIDGAPDNRALRNEVQETAREV